MNELTCLVCGLKVTTWPFPFVELPSRDGLVDVYGVCQPCRDKMALCNEAFAYIRDSNCDCLDEYGTPAPEKCDRCKILEKIEESK